MLRLAMTGDNSFHRTAAVWAALLQQAHYCCGRLPASTATGRPLTRTRVRGQHYWILAQPKCLKNRFPLIIEVVMPPERAWHCLPSLGRAGCLRTRCPVQASGPSSISCKYYICIAHKKHSQNSYWWA
uniref:Uncharacterized protein n=1 Tax=Molossus molossus TaxID=27622 RepID=A0A7J8FZE8_MOLMO|nr:hypothetical protein HJG59_008298 [Molossus molossus]